MVSVKEALKDSVDVRYARVSTRAQKDTLETQAKDIAKKLKGFGYTKKGTLFSEQGSGTKADRPILAEAIRKAVETAKNGKKVAFVVRDLQRFSRSGYDFGHLYKYFPTAEESLWFNDIPIVGLNDNIVTGTRTKPNPNEDLIGIILTSIGGQEIEIRRAQSLGGKAEAEKEGIVAGQPQNLYYLDDPNPIRSFYEMFFKMGMKQGASALALGRSRSWGKDLKNKMNQIIVEGKKIGNDNLIEEYLDTTDLIRDFEKEFGPRLGSKASKRMNAVSRKTSGYLKFPWRFEKPTREDLEFYYQNFKQFLPKRGK
jgi:DNA invertase Pin-like site-specific DNA recombinase